MLIPGNEPPTWLTVREASVYLRCGIRLLYEAIDRGDLKAAHLAGRRKIITRREWCDAFVEKMAAPVEVTR